MNTEKIEGGYKSMETDMLSMALDALEKARQDSREIIKSNELLADRVSQIMRDTLVKTLEVTTEQQEKIKTELAKSVIEEVQRLLPGIVSMSLSKMVAEEIKKQQQHDETI